MLAANYDITLDRAADYSFVLTIKDSASPPQPVDVSGNTFYADIRDAVTKEKVVSFVAEPSGVTDSDVLLSLTEDDTLLLNSTGSYEWDLFMVDGTIKTRLLYGSVTVRQNVTKGIPIDPTS